MRPSQFDRRAGFDLRGRPAGEGLGEKLGDEPPSVLPSRCWRRFRSRRTEAASRSIVVRGMHLLLSVDASGAAGGRGSGAPGERGSWRGYAWFSDPGGDGVGEAAGAGGDAGHLGRAVPCAILFLEGCPPVATPICRSADVGAGVAVMLEVSGHEHGAVALRSDQGATMRPAIAQWTSPAAAGVTR